MTNNISEAAGAGYHADAPNPHIWSSPSWLAFQAGRALHRHGASAPVTARMSRGFSIRVRTSGQTDFVVKFGPDLLCTTVERL
jgi:hypothetical protein